VPRTAYLDLLARALAAAPPTAFAG
jgi:hypothetical protein